MNISYALPLYKGNMNKYFYLVLLLSFMFSCKERTRNVVGMQQHNQAKKYDYCFTKESGVFVYSCVDKREDLTNLDGTDPCLSPDGTQIAFTEYGALDHERRIGLFDLDTKQILIL